MDCPSGKSVLAGGYAIDTTDDFAVLTSSPLDDDSWQFVVDNRDINIFPGYSIESFYVVCAFIEE